MPVERISDRDASPNRRLHGNTGPVPEHMQAAVQQCYSLVITIGLG